VGAAEHAWVDAIGHPTGRLVGKREPYAFDFEALCRACAATGLPVELNGPPRAYGPPGHARGGGQAARRPVRALDGQHQPGNLPFMKYAVFLARRAGLEAGDISEHPALGRVQEGIEAGEAMSSSCTTGAKLLR